MANVVQMNRRQQRGHDRYPRKLDIGLITFMTTQQTALHRL